MTSWADKTQQMPVEEGLFAPGWYLEAKAKGASRDTLFKLVRDFCQECLGPDGVVDDATVELQIALYETA